MRTPLFSKDKFRQFWNYKNKKLTIAFIINWTIIALIAVIFIIIISLNATWYTEYWRLNKANEIAFRNSLNSPDDLYLSKISDDAWDALVKFTRSTKPILNEWDYGYSLLILGYLFSFFFIGTNIILSSTKYLLSKKHNKNN